MEHKSYTRISNHAGERVMSIIACRSCGTITTSAWNASRLRQACHWDNTATAVIVAAAFRTMDIHNLQLPQLEHAMTRSNAPNRLAATGGCNKRHKFRVSFIAIRSFFSKFVAVMHSGYVMHSIEAPTATRWNVKRAKSVYVFVCLCLCVLLFRNVCLFCVTMGSHRCRIDRRRIATNVCVCVFDFAYAETETGVKCRSTIQPVCT